jgi:putative phosphoesterase
MSTRLRVLVTSDTHLALGARLPDALLRLAERADHVLHAGDVVELDVLDTIEALAPVSAIHGNCDDHATLARLEERLEVELGGVRLGMVHDPGPVDGRHRRLASWFPECDVIVYGHTHMPELARLAHPADPTRELLVLNPGSPTRKRRAPHHTAAWLELVDGRLDAADLVQLDAAPEP